MSEPSFPADNSAQLQAQQFQQEAAARAEQEATRVREQGEFDTRLGEALGVAQTTGSTVLGQRGLGEGDFGGLITNEINRIRGTIPNLDASPGTFFTPGAFNLALDTSRDAERAGFQNQINTIAPEGFARGRIGETTDDDIINAILGEQRGEAANTIQGARSRGLLTDAGFNDATRRLETNAPGALSSLSQFGSGILEQGRGDLRSVASEGRTNAGLFELGGTFNPESVRTNLDERQAEFSTGLEGRLRSGAPTELFNVDDILSRSQAGQGVTNTAGAPLADVLAQREQRKQAPRGLGTQGAF